MRRAGSRASRRPAARRRSTPTTPRGILPRRTNTASGVSSNYGYAAADPHLLTLATAPPPGEQARPVFYGATTQEVTPLTAKANLRRAPGQFLAENYAGSLTAGATDSFAFLLTASEAASTSTGTVLVGVDIEAAAGSTVQLQRGAGDCGLESAGATYGPGKRPFGLFAISQNRVGAASSSRKPPACPATSARTRCKCSLPATPTRTATSMGADGTLVASFVNNQAGYLLVPRMPTATASSTRPMSNWWRPTSASGRRNRRRPRTARS